MDDTPLDMARRHLAQVREQIARLHTLIPHLKDGGHVGMAEEAGTLLASMMETQDLAERHVAQLEARCN